MTEASDWHLPVATVTRAVDLRPEPKPQPLSYVEMAALDTHPATRYPYPMLSQSTSGTATVRMMLSRCFAAYHTRVVILGPPGCDHVKTPVLRIRHHLQVLRSVVGFVTVDMVNNFGSQQRTSEHLFNDNPMLGAVALPDPHIDQDVSRRGNHPATTPARCFLSMLGFHRTMFRTEPRVTTCHDTMKRSEYHAALFTSSFNARGILSGHRTLLTSGVVPGLCPQRPASSCAVSHPQANFTIWTRRLAGDC